MGRVAKNSGDTGHARMLLPLLPGGGTPGMSWSQAREEMCQHVDIQPARQPCGGDQGREALLCLLSIP